MFNYQSTSKPRVCSLAPARRRNFGLLLAVLILCETFIPGVALALTSGPSQPEYLQFQPVGSTEMVDLFTGDFSYNLPLFELPGPNGGYPFNLSYQSGVTMDQEASWVGLGWSLNPGAVNRTVRGVPDDFNGEEISQHLTQNNDVNASLSPLFRPEFIGINGLPISLTSAFKYNSRTGWSKQSSLSATGPDVLNSTSVASFQSGFSLSFDSQEGSQLDIDAKLDIGGFVKTSGAIGIKSGEGVKSMSFNANSYVRGVPVNVSSNVSNGLSFNPSISNDQTTVSNSLNYKFGPNAPFSSFFTGLTGTVNITSIKDNNSEVLQPSFGYFHLKDRERKSQTSIAGSLSEFNTKRAIMDYQLNEEVVLSENQPNLKAPNTSPDVYSVSAQGVGGVYIPIRNDVGLLTPPLAENRSIGFGLGAEFAGGALLQAGVDVSLSGGVSIGHGWRELGEKFGASYESSGQREDWSRRGMVSLVPTSYMGPSIGTSFGINDAVTPDVSLSQTDPIPAVNSSVFRNASNLRNASGQIPFPMPRDVYDANEISSPMTILRNEDIVLVSENSNLLHRNVPLYSPVIYDRRSGIPGSFNVIDLDRNLNTPDQVGAIQMKGGNGLRYVYALPVINHTQFDVMYGVTGSINDDCARIDIPDNQDLTRLPTGGRSGYRKIVETPPYASSHLLTSVLGTDYIDPDGNGPDEGDPGYWVRFEYDWTSDDYKWRAPFLGANRIRNHHNDQQDDFATFTTGSRDQYMVSRAVTETHEAIFFTSESGANDAKNAVAGAKSGFGSNNLIQNIADPSSDKLGASSYRLDSIQLFTRQEIDNVIDPIPLKTILFQYDDELCKGVENGESNSGKLTLKKVSFVYQNNRRGEFTPYEFSYGQVRDEAGGETIINFDYDPYSYDRWGMPNPNSDILTGTQNDPGLSSCDLEMFPYPINPGSVDPTSNTPVEDAYAANRKTATSWQLTTVKMPSGSTIEVDYDRDTYSYVQDRRATQMYPIVGIGSSLSDEIRTSLDPSADDLQLNVRVGNGANPADFFADLNSQEDEVQILINARLVLNPNNNGIDQYENVQSYVSIDKSSATLSNGILSIPLKAFDVKKGSGTRYYHPLAVAAWQYVKLNFPHVQKVSDRLDSFQPFGEVIGTTAMGDVLTGLLNLVEGIYKKSSRFEIGRKIDLDRSFVRLTSPNGEVYGGGNRVRQIRLEDNWNDQNQTIDFVSSDSRSTFGQSYSYASENPSLISSGIATNEPSAGYESCALVNPDYFQDKTIIRSKFNLFQEFPLNRSYLPSPHVGYSRVIITPLATSQVQNSASTGASYTTNGQTVQKFYTAKDFPTIQQKTDIDSETSTRPFIATPFFTLSAVGHVAAQGHRIELNDMHGKFKSVETFATGVDGYANFSEAPTSSVVHEYYASSNEEGGMFEPYLESSNGPTRTQNRLVNTVAVHSSPTVDNRGDILSSIIAKSPNNYQTTAELGVTTESIISGSRKTSVSVSVRGEGQFEIGQAGIFPIPGTFSWGGGRVGNENIGVAKTNVIVRKRGILKSITSSNGTASATTEYLVFDESTGAPIVSSSTDEFGQPIFSSNYALHNVMDRAGLASLNEGLQTSGEIERIVNGNQSTFCYYEYSPFDPVQNAGVPIAIADHPHLNDFKEGDELILWAPATISADAPRIFRVLSVDKSLAKVYLESADVNADPVFDFASSTEYNLVISSSGRTNQLGLPAVSYQSLGREGQWQKITQRDVGPIIALTSNSVIGEVGRDLTFSKVVNSDILAGSATLYSDVFTRRNSDVVESSCDCQRYTITISGPDATSPPRLNRGAEQICLKECPLEPDFLAGEFYPLEATVQRFNADGSIAGSALVEEAIDLTTIDFGGNCNFEWVFEICPNGGATPNVQVDFEGDILVEGQNIVRSVLVEPDPPGGCQTRQFLQFELDVLQFPEPNCTPSTTLSQNSNLTSLTSFVLGERRSFRPMRQFALNGTRESSAITASIGISANAKDDGALIEAELFDYCRTQQADCWIETSAPATVDQDGLVSTSHDAIGTFSTVIRDPYNSQVLVSGNNVAPGEIGFTSFEYPRLNGVSPAANISVSNNEASFRQTLTAAVRGEVFNYSGTGYHAIVLMPDGYTPRAPDRIIYQGISKDGKIETRSQITEVQLQEIPSSELAKLPVFDGNYKPMRCSFFLLGCEDPISSNSNAHIQFVWDNESNSSAGVESPPLIVDDVSHTGDRSLELRSGTEVVASQPGWILSSSRAYEICGWARFSSNGELLNQFDVDTEDININITGATEGQVDWTGPIEGWRRFILTIQPDVGFMPTGIHELKISNATGATIHLDDVRLTPVDAEASSYVYDLSFLRVSDVLGANNFSTRYIYDEEGHFISTRQETLEGWITTNEVRQFLSIR